MDAELAAKMAKRKQASGDASTNADDDDDNGVEVLDSNVSTTSSAITHKMGVSNPTKSLRVDTGEPPIEEESTDNNDMPTDSNHNNSTVQVSNKSNAQALAAVGIESEQQQQQPITKKLVNAPFDEEGGAPISHALADGVSVVSSLQHSHNANDNKQSYAQQQDMIPEGQEYYDEEDEEAARILQRRNMLIIIMLLIFFGLVVAIGAGVGLAVKSNDNNPNDAATDGTTLQDGSQKDNTGPTNDDQYSGVGGGVDSDDALATQVPSVSPSFSGPCLPIELGIIFDKYSDETSWKLVQDNYFPEDDEKNVVVWESDYYAVTEYGNKAETFSKCFPPGYYTFVFEDKEGDGVCCYHGEGSYVLSSEGKIITIGGEMTSPQETAVFALPFVEPDPVDTNGDGKDDRLGWLMPYDSSSMTEGVDCENFRLVILTDEYGVETTWELFEGQDNSGTMIANGGPYGSTFTYVVDYCLASQKEYALYMYDWDGRGLCCVSGEGWYQVSSGDIVIRDKTEGFGYVNITQFVLPADGSFEVSTKSPTPRPTELVVATENKKTLFPTKQPTSMLDALNSLDFGPNAGDGDGR